jgi:peptide/nickel transport system substrate-binding protein
MNTKPKEKLSNFSRRRFLKTASLMGAAAAVPGVFNILGRSAEAADSKCRVLMVPTAKITPPTIKGGSGQNVASMLYDWLVRLEGPQGKLTPSLAESHEHSADMTAWTFKLRDNVKFHHGTQFTADDVVYTAKRWLDPAKGGSMKTVFANVKEVTKSDKLEVTFKLSKPDPDFLLKLLEYNACILAHDYDYDRLGDTKPSGTGAFKVKQLIPGQRIVMDRNQDYFVAGLPKVNQMQVIFIPEIQTQLMTLEAGQAEVIRWLGFDSVLRYQNHPKVDVHQVKVANHANFYMRTDQPPFNDNRVRLAMKCCVDRDMILQSAAYGYGVVGNDAPVWPLHPLYTDIGFRQRDIEKAKQLLAEAGHKKGLDVDVYVPSNHPPLLDVALAMQQLVKPAGVNLQINGVTRDIYYGRYWLKVNCGITNWAHRENPIDLMNLSLRSGVPWNESHFSSPKLDRLLDAAAVEIDVVKRKTAVKDIEEYLVAEGPSVIPFFYYVFAATRKGVKGFQMVRNMSHDYRHIEVS